MKNTQKHTEVKLG